MVKKPAPNLGKATIRAISFARPVVWAGAISLLLGGQAALADSRVYVPLGGAGKILAIDPAKDAVVGNIDDIPAVHGLAETPDGRFLVAGSFEERMAGSMMVAKPSGVSEDAHAAHHGGASSGATMPDAPKGDDSVSTLSIIDTASATVVRRIDVPAAVHHVAVGPQGRFAVVTHPNEGTVSAIDLAAYAVVATIATGPTPNYAIFDGDGGRLFVSNAGNNTISEVDTAAWAVRRNIPAGEGPEHLVLSPDGTRLYAANVDDGTVSEIAIEKGETLRRFDIGGRLHAIDLSKKGETLFVSASEQGKLIAVDLSGAQEPAALSMPAPYHLASIGDSGKLYVTSADQPEILVINATDLTLVGKISIGGKGHQLAQSSGN